MGRGAVIAGVGQQGDVDGLQRVDPDRPVERAPRLAGNAGAPDDLDALDVLDRYRKALPVHASVLGDVHEPAVEVHLEAGIEFVVHSPDARGVGEAIELEHVHPRNVAERLGEGRDAHGPEILAGEHGDGHRGLRERSPLPVEGENEGLFDDFPALFVLCCRRVNRLFDDWSADRFFRRFAVVIRSQVSRRGAEFGRDRVRPGGAIDRLRPAAFWS